MPTWPSRPRAPRVGSNWPTSGKSSRSRSLVTVHFREGHRKMPLRAPGARFQVCRHLAPVLTRLSKPLHAVAANNIQTNGYMALALLDLAYLARTVRSEEISFFEGLRGRT